MFQDYWLFGELPGNTKEFKVDFDSIYKGIDEGKEPKGNKGSSFEVAPDAVQLYQWDYTTYIRILLLDKDNNVMGATLSDNSLSYGKPRAANILMASGITLSPHPYLKTANPINPNAASKEFPTGIAIYSGGTTSWVFSLNEIPLNPNAQPLMVEYQVSTIPFSIAYGINSDEYMNPAGLVYRKREPALYITKSMGFKIPFEEFAPSTKELGNNTITYYVRAVAYYKGTLEHVYSPQELKDGMWDGTTLLGLATKGDVVYYTGNYSVYESKNTSAALVGVPEDVIVKSNVPKISISAYAAPRWALKNPEEYFEVTRRIMPDEWGFWLTNNATGEKLNPYSWHLKNEKMSKEEYQKKIDRMVPQYASFHVVPKQKNWFEKTIGGFAELFNAIYDSVKSAYNGFKAKLINTLAEGFGKVFGGKAFFEKVFTALADYGLVSIGLPPSLPNSDILAINSMDYLVRARSKRNRS